MKLSLPLEMFISQLFQISTLHITALFLVRAQTCLKSFISELFTLVATSIQIPCRFPLRPAPLLPPRPPASSEANSR